MPKVCGLQRRMPAPPAGALALHAHKRPTREGAARVETAECSWRCSLARRREKAALEVVLVVEELLRLESPASSKIWASHKKPTLFVECFSEAWVVKVVHSGTCT